MSNGWIGFLKSSEKSSRSLTLSLSSLFIARFGRRQFSNESAGGPRFFVKFAATVFFLEWVLFVSWQPLLFSHGLKSSLAQESP